MATAAQIAALRLRQPELPASATDAVIGIHIDDAALEFDRFGISTTEDVFDKMLSLYALHLMTVMGITQDAVTSESVKDVSASYLVDPATGKGSRYYGEFMRVLRRRKYPYYIMHNT